MAFLYSNKIFEDASWEVCLYEFFLRKKSEQCRDINYASALLVIKILIMSIDSYEVASS